MAHQIKASLTATTPTAATQNTIENFLALGIEVPWDHMTWGQHVDRIIGRDTELTLAQAVEHFVDLCTVTRTLNNDESLPREALVFVGAILASRCRELLTFEAICQALFAETKEDYADTDLSHFDWTKPCLVKVAGDNAVVPRHLVFLYEQAGRPAISHRQVVRFVSQELHILRYQACEDNEAFGDGLPLEWVRGVFDRNQTKYIDQMVTVAAFGKDRVLEALQNVSQSEVPEYYAAEEDIPEGESDDDEEGEDVPMRDAFINKNKH